MRSVSASLAGLRAGGALAVDGARQKITGDYSESDFSRREALRFVEELGKLKGSYVKIGQMLALFGEHFLPPVLTVALHELEDSTAPLPWAELTETVEEELGARQQELDIDPEALASASLAQVHAARSSVHAGSLCLKIQYPNLTSVIDSDFNGVVRMLKAARWLKVSRDLDGWLEEMRDQLHRETDYLREAAITQDMARLLADSDRLNRHPGSASLHIPVIYPRYSTAKMMAMERCHGYSIKHEKVLSLPLPQRNELGVAMLRLFFEEVFYWGKMQTDPNFGNYLVELDVAVDGKSRSDDLSGRTDAESQKQQEVRLVLLDFGSVLELTKTQRQNLRHVILGGLKNDDAEIERGLRGLGWLADDATEEAVQLFTKFCHYLLEPLRPCDQLPEACLSESQQYRWRESELMQRVGKRGAKNAATKHFQLPAKDFSLFARKLTGVFTFIAYLGCEFNAYDQIDDYLNTSID